jgi:hypothetical protein
VRDVTAHDTITDSLVDEMGMKMTGLVHCTGPGMDDLRTRHAEGLGVLSRHRSAVYDAIDVDQAQAEVARHGDTMRTLLDAMDVAVDAMGCDP